jgi:hypothetical protein
MKRIAVIGPMLFGYFPQGAAADSVYEADFCVEGGTDSGI